MESLNKENLFAIFNEEIIKTKRFTTNYLCKFLNIHQGTIKRWIDKKAIPINYFLQINKLLNHKYEINWSDRDRYQLLDQFFSPVELAKDLVKKTLNFITKNFEIDFKEYILIEPAAGSGSFYFNFPKNRFKQVLGFDIEPQNKQIIKQDWLEYYPQSFAQKTIVIGNPPFGLRGQLALQFINHSAKFSDFVCFILPPLFNSTGKGSPMFRINQDFHLVKEFEITNNNFFYPNGKVVKVNSIFQIWTKKISPKIKPITRIKKASQWVKVYSLSNGNSPSAKRNVKMIDCCDYYLPSTTFKKIALEKSFAKLPHCRGYGIVILKNHQEMQTIIETIDWNQVAFKSTNCANNLRAQLIIDAIEAKIRVDN